MVTDADFSDRFSVTLPEGWSAEFLVLKADCEVKADGLNVGLKADVSVSLVQALGDDGRKVTPSSEQTQAAAKQMENDIRILLRECFALSQEKGADILRLGNTVFRNEGRDMPADYLARLNFSAQVKVTVRESS